MDNMEHAIEQAVQVIAPALEGHGMEQCSESGPNVHRRWIQCSCDEAVEYADVPAWAAHRAQVAARTLAEAGLLAPAPLREEWAVEGTLDSGDDWIADVEFATRLGAEDFLESNEWARRDGGHISRRYFTDWLPVDRAEGDGSADQ